MNSVRELKEHMQEDPSHSLIYLMNFVDEFRRCRNSAMIAEPIINDSEKTDALLASVVEYLCHESGLAVPAWVHCVRPCRHPWFMSKTEGLKAIALVESPVQFRVRKIFVLDNFLTRV